MTRNDQEDSFEDMVDPVAPRRSFFGRVVIVIVLLIGISLSAVGAVSWHDYVQDQALAAFNVRAASVSATLSTALRRDVDFVATQRAGVIAVPDLTNRELAVWYGSVDIASRFPGGVGFAFVQRVPAPQLSAFGAAVVADPLINEPVSAPYVVFPAGQQSEYCLQRFGIATSAAAKVIPPTFNFCNATIPPGNNPSPLPPLLDQATTTGQTTVLAAGKIAKTGGIASLFVVMSPVYATAKTPASVAGREAGLRGWIVATFSGADLLRSSVETAHHLVVSVSYDEPGSRVMMIATSGHTPGGVLLTRTVRFSADGSWVVRVTGSASSTATAQAIGVGILGGLVTVLLFLSFALLTRSRAMALRLVDKRTRQLRHLALHDPLTDLPNRVLILDRAEQMLIRARRHPLVVGALFIDLDKFKEVNDSFGHATGDRLLRAVGQRLSGALRASDSVGRLGGDEFVVLVEGDLGGVGPETVAQQILSLLAEPFTLDMTGGNPVRISASIGVALGPRSGAADLLRDADVALYVAKARGQHSYVVFRPDMHMILSDQLGFERRFADTGPGEVYQPTLDHVDDVRSGIDAPARPAPGRS